MTGWELACHTGSGNGTLGLLGCLTGIGVSHWDVTLGCHTGIVGMSHWDWGCHTGIGDLQGLCCLLGAEPASEKSSI